MLEVLDNPSTTTNLNLHPEIGREFTHNVSSDKDEWSNHQMPATFAIARWRARSHQNDDETVLTISSFSDQEAEPYIGPIKRLANRQVEIAQLHVRAFEAALSRIIELISEAQIEGLEVSSRSKKDLRAFLDKGVFTRRPFITLLDNGNFRMLWKNGEGEQIGLQFLGDKQIQYVLFAYRPHDKFMARSSGRDMFDNVRRQIEVQDLARLMKR